MTIEVCGGAVTATQKNGQPYQWRETSNRGRPSVPMPSIACVRYRPFCVLHVQSTMAKSSDITQSGAVFTHLGRSGIGDPSGRITVAPSDPRTGAPSDPVSRLFDACDVMTSAPGGNGNPAGFCANCTVRDTHSDWSRTKQSPFGVPLPSDTRGNTITRHEIHTGEAHNNQAGQRREQGRSPESRPSHFPASF